MQSRINNAAELMLNICQQIADLRPLMFIDECYRSSSLAFLPSKALVVGDERVDRIPYRFTPLLIADGLGYFIQLIQQVTWERNTYPFIPFCQPGPQLGVGTSIMKRVTFVAVLTQKRILECEAVARRLQGFEEGRKRIRAYRHRQGVFTERQTGNSIRVYRDQNWRTNRSFYEFNRCPLPREKIDLTISEVDEKRLREKTSLEPMRLEDVKKLIGPGRLKYKSIILILLQSGMRVGNFCEQFNTEEAKNVLKQLREGKCPIKTNLIASRKENPQYFTFIGRDAIDALKEYLNVGGEVKEGEPIFVTQMGNPITGKLIDKQIQILKRQTGMVNRNFTPHTLRDIFKLNALIKGSRKRSQSSS